MPAASPKLSPTCVTILKHIAEGRTYEQILSLHPDLTYLDIFAAAREVLAMAADGKPKRTAHMRQIKARHPRAYMPWVEDEDATLARLFKDGSSVGEIARKLQRQRAAIRSRLRKLGLTKER